MILRYIPKAYSYSVVFSHRIFLALVSFLMISGCQQDHPLNLKFQLTHNNQNVNCSSKLQLADESWQISQFQFYAHNFYVQDQHKQWHPAAIKANQDQSSSVMLLGGVCGADQNWQANLNAMIPADEIKSVKFTLGVPHKLNHLNPITQPSPLNQSDMFWTWQMGYKFARIELTNQSSEWIFHLGSTGCDSPSPVRAPEEACKNPNRANIRVANFELTKPINISLSELLQGIDLKAENNCQSAPSALCTKLMSRIGVNSKQTVFGVN